MSARTRWGIASAVLALVVIGFTSAWMPSFAAESATAAVKTRFNFWTGTWIKFRSAEEFAHGDGYNDQTKRMGIEVNHDSYTGNAIYTLTESGSIAAAPAPMRYVFKTIKGAGDLHAYRLQQYTGEVWIWGEGEVWNQVAPPPAEGGVFDLVMTPIGDEGDVNVMRIEQMTGETWWINAQGGPKKLAEPSKAQ